MEILNCTIEDSLLDDMADVLIVQIFEVDEGDDWGNTGVGDDSIIIDDDDIEGNHTIKDINTHPDRFQVDGSEETGYYIVKRCDQLRRCPQSRRTEVESSTTLYF